MVRFASLLEVTSLEELRGPLGDAGKVKEPGSVRPLRCLASGKVGVLWVSGPRRSREGIEDAN